MADTNQEKETISSEDKAVLDAIKTNRTLAYALAEKAVAQSEAADLKYQNLALQLAIKYKLSEKDSITESGEIIRKTE